MCHGQTYECVRLTHKTHRRTFSHAQCLRLNGSTELYEILQDDYNHSHLCFLQVSIINHPLTKECLPDSPKPDSQKPDSPKLGLGVRV